MRARLRAAKYQRALDELKDYVREVAGLTEDEISNMTIGDLIALLKQLDQQQEQVRYERRATELFFRPLPLHGAFLA